MFISHTQDDDYISSDLGIIRAKKSGSHCSLAVISSICDDTDTEFLTSGSVQSCEAYLSGIDDLVSISENETKELLITQP